MPVAHCLAMFSSTFLIFLKSAILRLTSLTDISQITINSEPTVGTLRHRWKEFHSAAIRQSRFDDLAVVGSQFDQVRRHPDAPLPHFSPCRRFLCLRRNGSSSQIINQAQDFPEQFPRHGDLGKLECDVPAMADNLGADLDKLLPQRGQRPVLDLLRQGQRPHEVGEIVGQGVKLEPNLVVAELAAGQPGPFEGLFALLDVLLRFASLLAYPVNTLTHNM